MIDKFDSEKQSQDNRDAQPDNLVKLDCVNVPISLATDVMRKMRRADCYESIYVSANDASYQGVVDEADQ